MFDYFVVLGTPCGELFCDFRRTALGKSGQLFHLYTIDANPVRNPEDKVSNGANILRDMARQWRVSIQTQRCWVTLLGHLEGGCKIDTVLI